MPTTTQFVVSGQSKPGVLARVASVLGEAGVNIKAFSAPEVTGTGTGKLRLLVADADGARAAFKAAKVKFSEETALLLSLENKPGAFKKVADLLTKSRINIKCGYCTPSREGKRAIVVLTVSNTVKALTILRNKSLDEF
ncbi:MAG: ACT domain-containing protein [Nitrospira sp.]|nr:ACT domain-containing protein [Nitrospira sp.]